MNVWDFVILLAVGALVLSALARMKKRRGGGCGCGCDGCGLPCGKRGKGGR